MAYALLCGAGGGKKNRPQIKIDGVLYVLNADETEYQIESYDEGAELSAVVVSNINNIPVASTSN